MSSDYTYLKRGHTKFLDDFSDSEEEELGDEIFKKMYVSSSDGEKDDIFKKMNVSSSDGEKDDIFKKMNVSSSDGEKDDNLKKMNVSFSCGEQKSRPESVGHHRMESQSDITSKIFETSIRSLGLLKSTEEIAVSTTQELCVQREQLLRTEQNLNEVNSSLKQSGKHINGIKSTFGMLKNFIVSKGEEFMNRNHKDQQQIILSEIPKSLTSDVKKQEESFSSCHPGLRVRGVHDELSVSFGKGSLELEEKINENLDDISTCIGRLKDLALRMGEEVDLQNKLLDNISGKTEQAIATLEEQNKVVKTLLK